MSVEELIERCKKMGVTYIELSDLNVNRRCGDKPLWHWYVSRTEPIRWCSIPVPWSIYITWLGFGPNPNKLWHVLPFAIGFWERIRIGIYCGSDRHGLQSMSPMGLEEGLYNALSHYQCDVPDEHLCWYSDCFYMDDCEDSLINRRYAGR